MIFWVIIVCYLAVIFVDHGLDWINIQHLKKNEKHVPQPFAGMIDQEMLAKTATYTVEKAKTGFFSSIAGQGLTIWFFFGGLLNYYNNWIISFNLSIIISGLLFFLFITYAQTFIGIPFDLIQTFNIEKRYGFTTTTVKLWITDLIKSLILSTILLSIVITIAFWLIQTVDQYWWLVVWAFFLIFSLFLMVISPYVLEPLFNKYTPLEEGPLTERIKILAAKAGIKVSRVFKMDASKRSRHTNAYFTGIGKVKRIVLYDTLLEKMTDDEVAAVLAHELGHWKKKHIFKRLIISEAMALPAAYAAFILVKQPVLINWFHLSQESLMAKLVIIALLAGLIMFPVSPLFSWYSRKHEREADDYAVDLTGEPQALRSALIKLSKDNLSNLHPHSWYAAFHYSHPPVVQRLARLENKIKKRA